MSKTIPDHFRALALDQQKLTGLLGSRVRSNSEGFLENVDLNVLLSSVKDKQENSDPVEREFPGRFLDAAADAYEHSHDVQLRSEMDKVATPLAALVQSTPWTSGERVTEATMLQSRHDLLGLLAYYRVTNEQEAYLAAQTLGTGLIRRLTNDSNRDAPQGETAVARLGLIEPFVRLYRLTGDKKYVDICKSFSSWLSSSELMDNKSSAAFTQSAAALIGFADLYEVTGDKTLLQPVTAAWQQVTSKQLSVTGAPIITSKSAGDARESSDACSTGLWMQFTFKLLRVTGEPKYGEELEKTVYNQVLADQDGRNGAISPEVALNGVKHFSTTLKGSSGRCLLSEAKAVAMIPQLVWGRFESGIAINLYTPGRAFFPLSKHGIVQIYSEGAYPLTGQLQFHVEPSHKAGSQFPVHLRVPSWAKDFTVDLPGIHVTGKPGEVVIVERLWKSGDAIHVSMSLPVSATAVGDHLVMQRGPQLLALEKSLNPSIRDMSTAVLHPSSQKRYQLFNAEDKLPRDWSGDQLYRISGDVLGKGQDLWLVPFADALNYRTEFNGPSD